MDGGEVALVAVGAAGGLALVVLVWAVAALQRSVRELQAGVIDLRAAVADADRTLEGADTVLAAAESVSARVDDATRLAHQAFSTPVIKRLAIASGTSEAARKLRRRRGKQAS